MYIDVLMHRCAQYIKYNYIFLHIYMHLHKHICIICLLPRWHKQHMNYKNRCASCSFWKKAVSCLDVLVPEINKFIKNQLLEIVLSYKEAHVLLVNLKYKLVSHEANV